MAKKKFNDLKKLSPQERIKKLKELEEKRKKEIEEAQKLIQESEEELRVKTEIEEKVPLPQITVEDLRQLETFEEKQIFQLRRFFGQRKKEESKEAGEKPLEKTLEEVSLAKEEEKGPTFDYVAFLSQRPANELYQEIRDIYQRENPEEEQQRILYLSSALEQKFKDINEGRYTPSEELVDKLDVAKQMVDALRRNIYQRKEEQYQS